jgi:hypothetical protein
VIEHICLIVAEVANRVLSEVRVIERENLEVRQSVQIAHLFETANFIATNIQIIERD